MLKKKFRLSRVSKLGRAKTINTPFFLIKYIESGEIVSKFAFIISKRVDKKAVLRNKVKRFLSNAVIQSLSNLNKSYTVIFIAKKEILAVTQQELDALVEKKFKEIGI